MTDLFSRNVTINDVARHAGVSRSTVSMVLRQSGRISSETSARVEASMRALGYTYNRAAANLRRRTSEAVGVIINDIRNPFFAEMIAGIQDVFDERGLLIYLVEASNKLDRQDRLLTSLIEHDVAGVILSPVTGTPQEFVDRLKEHRLKVCVAARSMPTSGFDFVGANNFEAARLATEHLIELGHQRIAFLGGEQASLIRNDRLAGYFSALNLHGILFDPELCTASLPSRAAAVADMEKVLDLPEPPTAAVAYNDYVAVSSMPALRARGIEPGRQFSLVGFDGTPSSETSFPSLTTVSLFPYKIGQEAATHLLRRMEKPDREIQITNLHPALIKRASTAQVNPTYQG